MPEKELKHLSKFMSLVLRHKPETIGLELDANGWAPVDTLIAKMQAAGNTIDKDILNHLVATNEKKRFAFDETGSKIRASQGHSVTIDLGYTAQQPPEILFHGTAAHNRDVILTEGLKKGSRHHVHLSTNIDTARQVGSRHGSPLVLTVQSGTMHKDGFAFYESENGVWLTDSVPAEYLGL
ncbi:RNA 2'-phosphotransferase [Flavobacterium akiainvivens]|uniref:Probable RNA 2'-phosphotransferase n=1 Tax=Flavobacterium akiainvivens TaxID=1202724 RepID=A0A0M8MGB3_9FLAO|nr:RNA 2'-phosphotransferase [Flavobacterium akiainvivens]